MAKKPEEDLLHYPQAEMRNHLGAINQLLLESEALFSSSSDGKISVWDAKTRTMLHEFNGSSKKLILREGVLFCVSFGNFGSEPGNVMAYDLRPQRRCYIAAYQGHFLYITDLVVAEDRIYTSSADKTCRSWDINFENYKGGEPLVKRTKTIFAGHQDAVTCLEYEPGALYSGSTDESIKIWALDGTCKLTLTGHTGGVNFIKLHEGKLYSSAMDETLRAWNPADGSCTLVIKARMAALTFGITGDNVFLQGSDPAISSFNIKTGKPHCRFEGHRAKINVMRIGHNHMYTGDLAGEVRRWNVKNGQCAGVFRKHTDQITSLLVSGHTLYSGSADTAIYVWDTKARGEELSWMDLLSTGTQTPATAAKDSKDSKDSKDKKKDSQPDVIVIPKMPPLPVPSVPGAQQSQAAAAAAAAAGPSNSSRYSSWRDFFVAAGVPERADEYEALFDENAIGLDQLHDLTADLLKEMNLKMGHIMKILKFIDKPMM